ncbi:MAG: hypothetical protein NZ874_01345 [Fimbriimonadales bacterium]|nr:hypothetical protein [Fimbriimonadales bacterium]
MRNSWRLGLAAVGVAALGIVLMGQARPRPETALLGVRVFTPITQVVTKFGNPTMVTDAQVTITELEEMSNRQQRDSQRGFGEQGSFGQPPRGEFGGPQGETRTETEIVYVYRAKGGSTYLFQFNKDGRVVQISAYGRRPDKKVRTSRGIGLGDPLAKIIKQYGQPDEHAFNGDVFVIRYNKLGVAFQLESRTNRVTGIFVAAGIPTVGAGFTSLGGGSGNQGGSSPSAPSGGGRGGFGPAPGSLPGPGGGGAVI